MDVKTAGARGGKRRSKNLSKLMRSAVSQLGALRRHYGKKSGRAKVAKRLRSEK